MQIYLYNKYNKYNNNRIMKVPIQLNYASAVMMLCGWYVRGDGHVCPCIAIIIRYLRIA